MRVAIMLGRRPHARDQIWIERLHRQRPEILDRDLDVTAFGEAGAALLECRSHRRQHGLVRRAQIDREPGLARDHVARGGLDRDHADGGVRGRGMLVADRIDQLDHARGTDERVAAPVHRRRAGMRFKTGDGDLVPALAHGGGDHADGLAALLQIRPLLDVRLEIGVHGFADLRRALVADAGEFIADASAIRVLDGVGLRERERTREHARRDHGRRKPRALLVGPRHDLDCALGLQPQIVHGAHDFERGQHTVGAVEFAPRRLGVEVTAGHHRRQVRAFAGTAREDRAHGIDAHAQPRRLAPRDEQIATVAVEIGEREAIDPALGRRADFRHLQNTLPETFAVYPEIGRRAGRRASRLRHALSSRFGDRSLARVQMGRTLHSGAPRQ